MYPYLVSQCSARTANHASPASVVAGDPDRHAAQWQRSLVSAPRPRAHG
jgi:hypothetical protein